LECIQEAKVAYVAGTSFYSDGGGLNTMRLNFSYETLEKNEEGVKRLAEFFKKQLAK
ncbi:MAG TPA: aminotransferase, partial [Candidatus Cloacimonetes bacterium]|nr:aminotransferase [Candidatus Cloacimonadota bacterium]